MDSATQTGLATVTQVHGRRHEADGRGRAGNAQPQPPRRAARRPGRAAAAERIAQELSRSIGANRYQMWFGQAQIEATAQHVSVVADSPFAARWIETHFSQALQDAAMTALESSSPVTISISAAPEAAAVERTEALDGSSADLRSPARGRGHGDAPSSNGHVEPVSAPRSPRLHSLDEFVVGGSNRLAHSAACRLAESDDLRGLSPLFIHGECGVGKTHLLQGICRRFIERTGSSARVRYVTGEQFTNEFIAALRTGSIESFRQRVRKLALLAIDDVHFLANKVKTQSEFQCTLDAIDFGGARVAMASDNHPNHIRRFSQSLISRFVSGMVVRVERPERELRCALIRRLAERRNLRLSQAAIDELAAQGGPSVRELEGTLTRLAAWRALAQTPAGDGEIGMLLVQQVLREDRVRPAHIVRIGSVIDAVCQRLSVTKADLVGTSRHKRVVVGRSMIAFLARELTTMSFPEIAQALGRENHSTVHTADQRLRRQMQEDQHLELDGSNSTTSLRELADLLRRDVCRAS